MTSPATPGDELEAIRRDIDRIDGALLMLLGERFAAVERVRAIKSANGSIGVSPLRPAREWAVLRRAIDTAVPHVAASLKVRLWRAIMAEATLAQAALAVHVSAQTSNAGDLRVMIAERFGRAALKSHAGEAQALEAVAAAAGDVAVLAGASDWAEAFQRGAAGSARVIAILPDLAEGGPPRAFVCGHARPEATGSDETMLISDGQLPRDFGLVPLWQLRSGRLAITALPGFLDEQSPPIAGLMRANTGLKLKIAGRYPSPIEAA